MIDFESRVHALSTELPARDAGSRGEELASETLADDFYKLGLKTDIDGFTCPGGLRITRSIYHALILIAALVCFAAPSMGVLGIILSVIGIVLLYLSYAKDDPLAKFFFKAESQNVVARYIPQGLSSSPRRGKIVITAHYDVKKPSIYQIPAIRKQYPIVRLVRIYGAIAVPVCCLLAMILPGVGSKIFSVIALIGGIVQIIDIADQLVGYFLKAPKGANNNASGLAVMSALAEKLATAEVRVSAPVYGSDEYESAAYGDVDARVAAPQDQVQGEPQPQPQQYDENFDEGFAPEADNVAASVANARVDQYQEQPEQVEQAELSQQGQAQPYVEETDADNREPQAQQAGARRPRTGNSFADIAALAANMERESGRAEERERAEQAALAARAAAQAARAAQAEQEAQAAQTVQAAQADFAGSDNPDATMSDVPNQGATESFDAVVPDTPENEELYAEAIPVTDVQIDDADYAPQASDEGQQAQVQHDQAVPNAQVAQQMAQPAPATPNAPAVSPSAPSAEPSEASAQAAQEQRYVSPINAVGSKPVKVHVEPSPQPAAPENRVSASESIAVAFAKRAEAERAAERARRKPVNAPSWWKKVEADKEREESENPQQKERVLRSRFADSPAYHDSVVIEYEEEQQAAESAARAAAAMAEGANAEPAAVEEPAAQEAVVSETPVQVAQDQLPLDEEPKPAAPEAVAPEVTTPEAAAPEATALDVADVAPEAEEPVDAIAAPVDEAPKRANADADISEEEAADEALATLFGDQTDESDAQPGESVASDAQAVEAQTAVAQKVQAEDAQAPVAVDESTLQEPVAVQTAQMAEPGTEPAPAAPVAEPKAAPAGPNSTIAYTPEPFVKPGANKAAAAVPTAQDSRPASGAGETMVAAPQMQPVLQRQTYEAPLVEPDSEPDWPSGAYQYSRSRYAEGHHVQKGNVSEEPAPMSYSRDSYSQILNSESPATSADDVPSWLRNPEPEVASSTESSANAGAATSSVEDADAAKAQALGQIFQDAHIETPAPEEASSAPWNSTESSADDRYFETARSVRQALSDIAENKDEARESLLNLPMVGSLDTNASISDGMMQKGLDVEPDADPFITRDDVREESNLTGSFAPLGATGVMKPVTPELLERYSQGGDIYVDDAYDDYYDSQYSDEGSFVGNDIDIDAEAPKKKRGLFKRRNKKDKKSRKERRAEESREASASEWLGLDEDYNATSEGAQIGSWDNFDDDDSDWRGGAYGGRTQEENRDAVAALSDDLLNKEVWFVALGASDAGSYGMKNLLRTRGKEIKHSRLINIESVGEGDIFYTTSEPVLISQKRTDSRLQKLMGRAAKASGVDAQPVDLKWRDTEATAAINERKRAISVIALDGDTTPGWKWSDDDEEKVSAENLQSVYKLMIELIKSC